MSIAIRNFCRVCGDPKLMCGHSSGSDMQPLIGSFQFNKDVTIKELEDKVKALQKEVNQLIDCAAKDNEEILRLKARLKEAEEVIGHLASSVHPYTVHEHIDTLEHRFGLQIECAREYMAKWQGLK